MRSALLIIDMQKRLLTTAAIFPSAVGVIATINLLRRNFASRQLPVFHVVMEHEADGSTLAIDAEGPWNVKGSLEAEIIAELSPTSSEVVISKSRYSSFFGTDLYSQLKRLDVNEVVLTGYQLRCCVLASCLDAYQNDFHPVVIGDGVLETSEKYFTMHLDLFREADWLLTSEQWLAK